MNRTTMTGLVVAGALVLGACGGSDEPSEAMIEELIENAARQEGEDIDVNVDFDDDGNFSIQTEDGEFSIQTDADGNVTFEGESDDGEFSINSDDGVTVIESDEGTATITQGGGAIPEGFPTDIPLPDGLEIQMSQTSDMGAGQTGSFIIGTAPGDWEAYLAQLTAALEALGYTQQSLTMTPNAGIFNYFVGDDGDALIGSVSDSGDGQISVQLTYSTN